MGIAEREFWRMTPREFGRRGKAHHERLKRESEKEVSRFYNTYNAIGLAWHGSKWKWAKPPADGAAPEDVAERLERVMAHVEERRRRKKKGGANG
jgi:hypothetical protein